MSRQLKASFLVLASGVLLLPCLILAQDVEPIIVGQKVRIHSDILKEDMVLWVHTPIGSHDPSARYPVMILLDGDTHFLHTTGIVKFLSDAGQMPKMILVGIESTDRVRDFTPATEPSEPSSGGASTFIRFISNELFPYVESHYPTAPFRALVGHSLGGSFVLNILFTNPRMFNAYFILSPNLWWASDTLVKQLEVFLTRTPKLKAFVYETATTQESPRNIAATSRLRSLVETSHVDSLHWTIAYMPSESHSSIVHRSIYDGLESLFSRWKIPGDLSALGMPGLQQHYRQLSDRYGYTIEPAEDQVNALGYKALSQGKLDEAIAIFKWNVEHYPKSSNVYDSLGEAYAKKGEKKLALENYEKSIELNPKNTTAIEIVKKLKSK